MAFFIGGACSVIDRAKMDVEDIGDAVATDDADATAGGEDEPA